MLLWKTSTSATLNWKVFSFAADNEEFMSEETENEGGGGYTKTKLTSNIKISRNELHSEKQYYLEKV